MQLLILLACFLLQGTVGQAPQMWYMLLMPAEIQHPERDTVCVHLSGVTELVHLTVTLQSESRDSKLMDIHTEGPDLQECRSFQVPPPAGGSEEVCTVQFSLTGANTRFYETKQVLIKRIETSKGFIQTDKPVYKPEQTVCIRAVTLNQDFIPSNEKYPLLEILDPNGYRICQWQDVTPRQGILDVNFTLSSEPVMGMYTVKVTHLQIKQTFLVSEMVFPKFDVTVLLPTLVTLEDESFQLKVCGRYTYERPVSGYIQVTLCHPAVTYYWYAENRPEDICMEFHDKTDKNGCLVIEVDTEDLLISSIEHKLSLEARATLMEAGTGLTFSATGSCPISPTITSVTFEESDMDTYYKQGIRYRGKIQLLRADGTAMKRESIYLTVEFNRIVTERVYITDEAGRASFVLETSAWDGYTVYLKAQHRKEKPEYHYGEYHPVYPDTFKTLYPFTSLVNSFVKIQPPEGTLVCEQEYPVEVDYIIRWSDLLGGEEYLRMNYFVMARGNIALQGQTGLNISIDSVVKGTHYIQLPVTADIAPQAKLLIFAILKNGRVMADTAEFSVSKCFKNKVQMDFSAYEGLPGSNISLQLQAAPGSLCALQAVDKSVTFIRAKAELTPDSVYRLVASRNPVGYPFRVQERDPPCWYPRLGKRSLRDQPEDLGHNIQKRYSSWAPTIERHIDVFSLIKRMGLKVLTNSAIKKPSACNSGYPPVVQMVVGGSDGNMEYDPAPAPVIPEMEEFYSDIPESEPEKKDVRKNFPETWLWKLAPMNSSGQANLMLTMPDTITAWNAMMFCTADIGFGLSPTETIRAFKPVFMDLTLPYSVIRGETFPVQATVFNYLKQPIQVQVTLAKSWQFDLRPCPDCNYTSCLPADTGVTFTWHVVATTLGEMSLQVSTQALDTEELCDGEKPVVPEKGGRDTLEKSILVKPEGVLVAISHNTLLCAGGNLSSEVLSIDVPSDMVKGSARAVVSVVGDMMGMALENTDHLVVMPYGCGEQNMAKLAPLIFLCDYLEKTGLMTELIKRRATDYITKGMQRQRAYKRIDGSFSPFGERDVEPNIWLTALVMTIFRLAKAYVPVDDRIIREALSWLEVVQLLSGCFPPIGKPFKNSQMGVLGNDAELSTTAYVTARLLEMKDLRKLPVVENALTCLRNATHDVENTHTLAMLAYVYAMSGDVELCELMLGMLYDKADTSDGNVFWTLTPQASKKSWLWTLPEKGTVETSSLVLLAHLCKENVTKEDIKNASQIAGWITRQQNHYGGFASTQDTTEALKALGTYATWTYSSTCGINLALTSSKGFRHVFTVNNSSRLLLQQAQLPDVPGEYLMDVEGEGCLYVQTTLKYNASPPKKSPSFYLTVGVEPKYSSNSSNKSFNIKIHTRYTGPRETTNMALIEVGLPSGFSTDTESLKEVEKNPLVKRIDSNHQQVLLYLEQLTHNLQNFTFEIHQDILVEDQRPVTTKVYDYYKPEDNAAVEYSILH